MKHQLLHTLTILSLSIASAYADVTLNGNAGGDVASANVLVTLPTREEFVATLDGGSSGIPAPDSLSVFPDSGFTDATITITGDPSRLQPGTVSARLVISFQRSAPIIQNVIFKVSSAPPKLEVLPNVIVISGVSGSFIGTSTPVFVRNSGGGGPQRFTASIIGANTSFLTLSATSGTTNQVGPALFIGDQGTPRSKTGAYSAILHLVSGSLTQDIPITYLAKPDLLFFQASQNGLTFKAQKGVGTAQTQTISLLAASAPVSWTASIASATDFLTVTPTSANTSPGAPGKVTIGVKPLSTPGVYYATVTIKPNVFATQISPIVVTVVYIVTDGPPQPELGPAGLVFTSVAGSAPPAAQTINVFTASNTAQVFEVGLVHEFIQVNSPNGTAFGASPTPVAISVASAGLNPDIYRGTVQINFPQLGTYRIADVLQVVLPAGSSAGGNSAAQATCSPTKIAVTGTTVAGNFSQPAAYPAVVQSRVVDDCGNNVNNAKVVVSFSNGDPPLNAPLEACSAEQGCGAAASTYAATWVSTHPGPVTMTVRASSGTMSASANYSGAITANSAPVVSNNGTVNNLFVQAGAPLAPGTIAAVYGSGLTGGTTGQASLVPLPGSLQGTSVVVGGISAPFYYASDGQLNVQLPAELNPNQTYNLVVTSNGAISVPQLITVGSATPGVAAFADGRLIAQHLDFTLIDSSHPAKPGETIVMYLDGMGATNPPVPTGTAAPASPLAQVVNTPVVTVGGDNAPVFFAGLTPNSVGLYQIDFTIPTTAKPGNLTVTVSQNGIPANSTTLPVAAQ